MRLFKNLRDIVVHFSQTPPQHVYKEYEDQNVELIFPKIIQLLRSTMEMGTYTVCIHLSLLYNYNGG